MISITNLKLKYYIVKVCPQCGTEATRYDAICGNCGALVSGSFDLEGFKKDIQAYIATLLQGRAEINARNQFRDLFGAYPQIGMFLERKIVASLLILLKDQQLPRITAELEQLMRSEPDLTADLRQMQQFLADLDIKVVNSLDQLRNHGVVNPLIPLLQDYALAHGDYLVQKHLLERAGEKSAEVIQVSMVEPKLEALRQKMKDLLDRIDNIAQAVQAGQSLGKNYAHYVESVANMPQDRFQPTVARILDEYDVTIKIMQNVMNIGFQNGKPIQVDAEF